MAAGVLDLLIQQGETFIRYMTIQDSDVLPIDISGNTFRGVIKLSAQATDPIATFTFAMPGGGTDGVVTFNLTDTETSAIPAVGLKYNSLTKYVYDIEMEDALGKVTRLLNGTVSVSPEVTK